MDSFQTAATISSLINYARTQIVKPIITILIVLATIVFIIGLIKLLLNAKDSKKLEEGRKLMLWGIIGLFAIVAMWGLVTVIQRSFGINEDSIPAPDDLPEFEE